MPHQIESRKATTVSFWMYWIEPRQITLSTESPIFNFHDHWTDDEGTGYLHERFQLKGGIVHRETRGGGTDCDGPIHHYHRSTCPVANLNAGHQDMDQPEIRYPSWTLEQQECRDEQAIAAGY